MNFFSFALEDWLQLRIGGRLDCYVRPNRPYTIMVDRDQNKVALTLNRSSNSNWYFEEYMKMVEAGQVLSLNQTNVLRLESQALLSEATLGIFPADMYSSLESLLAKDNLYPSIFRVHWEDGDLVQQFGWLGIRNRSEYLLVLNCLQYLAWPTNSHEYMKAQNIMISLTGIKVNGAVEVGHSPNGLIYVWHESLEELQST